ncbi:MAG: hypothetical protein R3240_04620 [Gammaproteobacteria bacterium]|nr:hypothetical protein [Gammaproteobacteria bacterium]
MRRYILILFLILFTSYTASALADSRKLVLVTAKNNDIPALNAKELKKVYLGLIVKKQGNVLTPILNHTESLMDEVFLQNVIFMSSRNYERQLNSRTFRSGKRIHAHSSLKEIIDSLQKNNNSITYLWESDAKKYSNIKIIQNLWAGSVD